MFATFSRSGRILRSVFFAGGSHRTIGRSHDRAINNAWRISMARSIISLEILRLVVAINVRSYDQSWPPDDRSYDQSRNSATDSVVMSVNNRLVVPPVVRFHDQF